MVAHTDADEEALGKIVAATQAWVALAELGDVADLVGRRLVELWHRPDFTVATLTPPAPGTIPVPQKKFGPSLGPFPLGLVWKGRWDGRSGRRELEPTKGIVMNTTRGTTGGRWAGFFAGEAKAKVRRAVPRAE